MSARVRSEDRAVRAFVVGLLVACVVVGVALASVAALRAIGCAAACRADVACVRACRGVGP